MKSFENHENLEEANAKIKQEKKKGKNEKAEGSEYQWQFIC